MYGEILKDFKKSFCELFDVALLEEGDIVVIGGSSSEILGNKIGTGGSLELARAIIDTILEETKKRKLFLAVQCCEHLNRSLITEKDACAMYRLSRVNVVPQEHAGGAFATSAWAAFSEPVAVENVSARAGIDIGDTLIGMHMAPVCVPFRSSVKKIGQANIVLARSRYKCVGGPRAVYDEKIM